MHAVSDDPAKSSVVLDRELEQETRREHPVHASGARSAAGRPARTTAGLAPAATSGTLSIRVECAPRVFNSGLRPSACHVPAGRRIRNGMCSEERDSKYCLAAGYCATITPALNPQPAAAP